MKVSSKDLLIICTILSFFIGGIATFILIRSIPDDFGFAPEFHKIELKTMNAKQDTSLSIYYVIQTKVDTCIKRAITWYGKRLLSLDVYRPVYKRYEPFSSKIHFNIKQMEWVWVSSISYGYVGKTLLELSKD